MRTCASRPSSRLLERRMKFFKLFEEIEWRPVTLQRIIKKASLSPFLKGSSIWVSKPWDLTYFSDMSESRLKRVWKGCKSGVKIWKQGRTNKIHLWLLPFSKDSSSSSLFSRSLLFMKGNFLLKLIFCFALGPRLRVPVDLHSIKLLLLISRIFNWTWQPTNFSLT